MLMFLLSYRRKELGFRISIYISASTASGAFGGLLAIGLSKIPQWGMIHTWRNIYIFEVGIIDIFYSLTTPNKRTGFDLSNARGDSIHYPP